VASEWETIRSRVTPFRWASGGGLSQSVTLNTCRARSRNPLQA